MLTSATSNICKVARSTVATAHRRALVTCATIASAKSAVSTASLANVQQQRKMTSVAATCIIARKSNPSSLLSCMKLHPTTTTTTTSTRAFSSTGLPAGVSFLELPALSPTMESGSVAVWHKKAGETVRPGDAICDVTTDKASVTFEAQEEFILAAILVSDSAKSLAIGAPIGLMVESEEDVPKAVAFAKTFASGAPAPASPASPAAAPAAAPAASKPTAASSSSSSSSSASVTHTLAFSPAVLHILGTHHIDPSSIKPTGPKGRLLKGDILAAMEAKTARYLPASSSSHASHAASPSTTNTTTTTPSSASAPSSARATTAAPLAKPATSSAAAAAALPGMSARRAAARTVRDTPLEASSSAFAQAFAQGKRSAPHMYLQADVDVTALLSYLTDAHSGDAAKAATSLSAYAIRAVAGASEAVIKTSLQGQHANARLYVGESKDGIVVAAPSRATVQTLTSTITSASSSSTSTSSSSSSSSSHTDISVTLSSSDSPVAGTLETLAHGAVAAFTFTAPRVVVVLDQAKATSTSTATSTAPRLVKKVTLSAAFDVSVIGEDQAAKCVGEARARLEDVSKFF